MTKLRFFVVDQNFLQKSTIMNQCFILIFFLTIFENLNFCRTKKLRKIYQIFVVPDKAKFSIFL